MRMAQFEYHNSNSNSSWPARNRKWMAIGVGFIALLVVIVSVIPYVVTPGTAKTASKTQAKTSTVMETLSQMVSTKPKGIMLVVTGSPMSNATETSEVFDLEHPEYECDNLGNFPDKVSEAIGGLLGNRPVICSGMDTGNTKSSKCYTMGELGQPSATLQTGRWLAAGTLINETTMWITGGIGQDWDHLTSTEFVYSNHNTSMGPSLPQTRYSHCMLKVRSSVIAIIGGGNGATAYQETVWFYNFDREKFVNGSGLIQARMHHVCGLITDSLNRKPIMVVAAGRADGHQFLDTTELWADDSEKWVKGPDMPVKISGPSSMVSADGNHFIMVGGESLHYQELYEIYKLQCFNLNCEWEKMPHELNVARQESVAMLIPSNMTRCQPVGSTEQG